MISEGSCDTEDLLNPFNPKFFPEMTWIYMDIKQSMSIM